MIEIQESNYKTRPRENGGGGGEGRELQRVFLSKFVTNAIAKITQPLTPFQTRIRLNLVHNYVKGWDYFSYKSFWAWATRSVSDRFTPQSMFQFLTLGPICSFHDSGSNRPAMLTDPNRKRRFNVQKASVVFWASGIRIRHYLYRSCGSFYHQAEKFRKSLISTLSLYFMLEDWCKILDLHKVRSKKIVSPWRKEQDPDP